MTAQPYQINDFLSVKMEGNHTALYVNNKKFKICKKLQITIQNADINDYDNIDSIDHLSRLNQNEYHQIVNISPRDEFWGHCSVRHEAV